MTSFALKILGILTMFIDHIGFMFYPNIEILRVIGRIAFPVFAYQLAIGYSHTKSKEKHIFRMLIFAIISQIPYHLFIHTPYPTASETLNIGFTLVYALIGMYLLDNIKQIPYKISAIMILLMFVTFLNVDYSIWGIALGIIFYIFKDSKLCAFLSGAIIVILKCILDNSTFSLSMILGLIACLFYNGKKGKNTKYLFYIFYPLHMLIFTLIYVVFYL